MNFEQFIKENPELRFFSKMTFESVMRHMILLVQGEVPTNFSEIFFKPKGAEIHPEYDGCVKIHAEITDFFEIQRRDKEGKFEDTKLNEAEFAALTGGFSGMNLEPNCYTVLRPGSQPGQYSTIDFQDRDYDKGDIEVWRRQEFKYHTSLEELM